MTDKLLSNLRKTVSQAKLKITCLPQCPDIQLYLLDKDFPRERLSDEDMHAVINSPAYWAFCWASGQVFARYIIENPHLLEGKTVVDFGAGSGVVAIAAARAGAELVYACDIDRMALEAISANASLNQVSVVTCCDLDDIEIKPDVIIAADVLYDRDNHHYLTSFPKMAEQVLLADSRMKVSQLPGYDVVAEFTSCTLPDLQEYEQFNRVKIYRALNPVTETSDSAIQIRD